MMNQLIIKRQRGFERLKKAEKENLEFIKKQNLVKKRISKNIRMLKIILGNNFHQDT